MENELFAILEEDAQDRSTHRACLRAVARANKQFGAFFKQAASDDDYMARFELVRDRVSDIVREACIEEGSTSLDIVAKVLAGELARLGEVERDTPQDEDVAPSDGEDNQMHVRGIAGRKLLGLDDQEGESKTAAGGNPPLTIQQHDERGQEWRDEYKDRDDNFNLSDSSRPVLIQAIKDHEQKAAELRKQLGVADDAQSWPATDPNEVPAGTPGEGMTMYQGKVAVDTGDTYTQETVDLPKADDTGLSDEASPKIDMGSAGDENHTSQKPIDIPSVQLNPEVQDVTDPADYTATLEVPGVVKTVNADSPLQPEHHVAPGSETWHGTKDQANPVTSKWKVLT